MAKPNEGMKHGTNIGGKHNGNSNRKQYRWEGRCPLVQVEGSWPCQ